MRLSNVVRELADGGFGPVSVGRGDDSRGEP